MADMARIVLTSDTRGLKKGEAAMTSFARKGSIMERSVKKSSISMVAAMNKVGLSAAAMGAAVGLAAVAGFGSARGLDAALAEASTLLEGTTAEMSLMRKEARAMARDFGGNSLQQVEAFYQAISAGAGSVEEASTLLRTANLLAKGGVTDITTSVDILTTAVNSYAGSGLTAAQASDILFTGVKFGKTTVEELASSLGKAAPLAAKLGLDFEELVAATAALTKGGLSTAEAITGVKGVMAAILKPTQEAATAAKDLGLEFNAGALASKGLVGFLDDVITATGGSTEEMAKLFGGMEGLSGVLGLTANGAADVKAAMESMGSSLGATQAAADKIAKELSDRLNIQLGKLAAIAQQFGTALLNVVVPALELLTSSGKALAVVVVALAATQIPLMVLALRVATVGMTAASIATGAFTAAVNLARFATIALGGPLGIIWGLVGAVGASLIIFKDNFKTAGTAMDDAKTASRALNVALGDFYYTAAPEAGRKAIDLANDNYELAKSALAAAEGTLAQMRAIKAASTAASAGMGGMSQFVNVTTNPEQMAAASEAFEKATTALAEAKASLDATARSVTGQMSEEMADAVEITRDLSIEIDSATTAITGAGGLKPAVETLADKMKTELASAIDSVSNAFGDWMKRGFKDFKSFAGSILSTFKTMLINMITMAAKNKIMISLGLGGSAVGTAASAAGTGMLGTAIGGFGAAGVAGTGLLGGLGAVGAGTAAGFASGGIGGALSGFAGSTAAGISGGIAAGGVAGIGAAIGAALPIIGIGLALFSLFKKKPPYKEKDFNAIQAAIELTNMELLNTNTAGQKAATALKKAFGGLENMQRATESYYNNFFSNEEKRLRAIEGIDGVFASLGIAVPTTATAFRDIVEAQDLMTSEGRDTYSALLQVSDAFAQVYGGVNDVTDALMALNASVGGSIFSTLVDERRAAAYQRNGIAFDVDQPERAGGGIAYRGTGPRITTTAQAEADKLAESLAEQSDAQTSLLIDIQKSTTRTLRIYDSWDVVGLPPERT